MQTLTFYEAITSGLNSPSLQVRNVLFFPTQIIGRNQTFPSLPYQNLALLPMKERKVTVVVDAG